MRGFINFLMLAGAVQVGCTSSHESPVGYDAVPIIGGEPAPDEHGVVLVVEPNVQGCTGIALSRRVVLTASYCVRSFDPVIARVYVGPDHTTPHDPDSGYPVSENIRLGGVDELSLLVLFIELSLDEGVAYDLAVPEHPTLAVGDPVRFVGYGNTIADDNSTAGRRMMRSGSLTSVDSQALQADVGVCFGDAGGPLLDSNDVVLGVAISTTSVDCEQASSFVRVDQFFDQIVEVFNEIGDELPFEETPTSPDELDADVDGAIDVDGGADGGDASDMLFMARGGQGCSIVAAGS